MKVFTFDGTDGVENVDLSSDLVKRHVKFKSSAVMKNQTSTVCGGRDCLDCGRIDPDIIDITDPAGGKQLQVFS